MIVKKMHEAGVRSEHAYFAAFVSIGGALVTWMTSNRTEHAGVDRADRWGIFIGEWAPTFFGLGVALSQYEQIEGTLDAQ
ncbi:hypothetical protein GCM10023347_29970 [Streptomyces chumphonensis]|uniref:Uncharacterized protein n=1 Tax=Streptomyces chumphonensis TaxID=1214925 RepID=A0A927EXE4_9ACTN|nr:hypothetical protein [Streptomyces chumphonensis]MBD3931133.1 hypothetical protein [Streptomyces chumphonensis]